MIIDDIKEELPKNAQITDVSFEGSEIILYTENRDFFRNSTDLIKKIVSKVKKRIEVRSDPSVLKDEETTKEMIREIVPEEAGIRDIYFEPEFAKVVIHAEKPGLVIGKSGETLLSIKEKTLWTPDIKRAPVIDSEIIRSIRKMLHREADYRKKFLNTLGEKIYGEGKPTDWVRLTTLGGFREVGRSCLFLQTPQSKVLMDCGISVKKDSDAFPHLDAPEFRIQDLDAIILSHAHMDHCLPRHTKVTMADGSLKPIGEVVEGDKVLSMNFETGKMETGKCSGKIITRGHKTIKRIKTPFRTIEASPNHRFFAVRNLDIAEVESQDLKSRELLPSTMITEKDEKPAIKLNTAIPYDPRRKDSVMLPNFLDENLASLVAYIQGDGHRSSPVSFRITDSDKSLLEFYKDVIYRLFNFSGVVRRHSDKTKNAWILEINNVKILRFLEKNFPEVFSKTYDIAVPKKILSSNRNVRAAYLRGFMDAEGSVTLRPPKVRFATVNIPLLKEIRSMFLDLGVPSTSDHKSYSIGISSLSAIREFSRKVGFNSNKKKDKLITLAEKESLYEKDIVPINSGDLKKLIKRAGLFGTVHKSPRFRDHLSLYDWLRRPESSYCTRRTATELISVLESRISELQELLASFGGETNLRHVRQRLSLSISSLAEEMEYPRHVIDYRESGYVDHIHQMLTKTLREKVLNSINATQINVRKIKKILALPVLWEQITEIETSDNPYEELIDIEVLPNRNFIADGIIVHNCGMLPYMFEYGYRGPVYCTRPTRDTMTLMQLDYLKICQRENTKAPYSSKGIEEQLKHCITLEYGEVTDIAPDMRLTLQNAGHILGSSAVHIHIGDGLYNILYTGDMRYARTQLFDPASTNYSRVETAIIESTYGTGERIAYADAKRSLEEQVRKALDRGGKVIIPSFATGRGQEVIGILAETNIDTTIYLDGMLWDATAIHTAYPEFMARHIQSLILHKGKNPFIDPRLKGVGSSQERKKVVDSAGPCVVVSTSGMLNGGPALEYLQRFADDKKNLLLFVGYQAEGTLGRRIQKGWKNIQLHDGTPVELNLEIGTVQGLGGHSSGDEILSYIRHLKTKPKKILTNHGDPSSCIDLARRIHKTYRIETEAPRNLETIRLR